MSTRHINKFCISIPVLTVAFCPTVGLYQNVFAPYSVFHMLHKK